MDDDDFGTRQRHQRADRLHQFRDDGARRGSGPGHDVRDAGGVPGIDLPVEEERRHPLAAGKGGR